MLLFGFALVYYKICALSTCMYVCMYVCVCMGPTNVPGACRAQKQAFDSLELEFQTVVSCRVGGGS